MALTSLRLLSTKVDDIGCRRLAPLLPALEMLTLSSTVVSDSGFRSLCDGLPKLCSLEVSGLMLTDKGLHAAGQLTALTRLVVSDCWLVSEKQAAAVAARGHALKAVQLNGRDVTPALTPTVSMGRKAPPRCSRTLSEEVKAFDDRWRYSRQELMAFKTEKPSGNAIAEMRARLPRDLRADLWKELM